MMFQKTLDALKSIALSSGERERVRARIRAHMEAHPAFAARQPALVVSPISSFFLSARFFATGAALVAVLAVGVGTTYAAEGALPGDTLYAVKVGLVEPAKEALLRSDAARMAWQAEKVERRLSEARRLAAAGRLARAERVELEQRISDALAAAQTVSAPDFTTIASAAEAQSAIEASFEASEKILKRVSERQKPEVGAEIIAIVETVAAKREAIVRTRRDSEARLALYTDEDAKAVALERKSEAQKKVRRLKAASAKVPPQKQQARALKESSDTTLALMAADVADAPQIASSTDPDSSIEQGERSIEKGAYGEALGAFQAAIRVARTAEIEEKALREIEGSEQATSTGVSPAQATSTGK